MIQNIKWVSPSQLARGNRPGRKCCPYKSIIPVETVDKWIAEVKALGIKSIICLLSSEELLEYYEQVPNGLIKYYRANGFSVTHIPAPDHKTPALTDQHLAKIWEAYNRLDKPVLVHCSAGKDRTELAVDYIEEKLSAISLT